MAFADPEPEGEDMRTSSGCLQGPFETGVEDDDGNDARMSFTVEDERWWG